jgi:hypothetical protein
MKAKKSHFVSFLFSFLCRAHLDCSGCLMEKSVGSANTVPLTSATSPSTLGVALAAAVGDDRVLGVDMLVVRAE